ncbi:hypothetical protein [Rhizobium laguerreae]|uniref:hypothetical protein n=1 Tax=Rhizobium laguerreae TaxID=1076926 RepID=UPI001C91FEF4|nr:hypothetical protein [Rhizobium laguerreae]MBY3378946.1 hypothetical protein [Rhizobium laguerreae]
MSSAPRSLQKEYGLLPLALSGVATVSVIILSIYYANNLYISSVYKGGAYIQCEASVAALISGIITIYKYPGLALIFISLVSVIFSYFYDRVLFVFVLLCFVIFNYPFAALLDNTKIILSLSSIETLCKSGNYAVLAIQLPVLFLSSYVIIGNIVLLAKRWLRGRTQNG